MAFPRGGSALTAFEKRAIELQADEDAIFESKRRAPGAKTPSKRAKIDETHIEHLSFANLLPGALVLCQITAVERLALVVAVGDNLSGRVHILAISPEMSSMVEAYESGGTMPKLSSYFSVGQWLRAVVVPSEDDHKKKLDFSIEPKVVNAQMDAADLQPGAVVQGSVRSVEDHGVVVDLGLKQAGFAKGKYKAGDVRLFAVTKATARTVTLAPVDQAAPLLRLGSVDAIYPASLVEAIVSDVSDGVACRVLAHVTGTISYPHLGTVKVAHKIGDKIRARVIGSLSVEHERVLVLSTLPQLMRLEPQVNAEPLEAFPVGFVFDLATIAASDSQFYYVALPGGIMGQVHKSNVDPLLNASFFVVGTLHRARVLGLNAVDNVLMLTFDPKQVDSRYVSVDEIPVGEPVASAEIIKLLPDAKGLVVRVFGQFDAFVPGTHMSDVVLLHPERKFKVGAKVRGRVLAKRGKSLYVTVRKSLVETHKPLIVDAELAAVGVESVGCVEKVFPSGALVSFFGGVRAFLPKLELSETAVDDVAQHIKVGQPVTVRVASVELDGRISVTMRQSEELGEDQVEFFASLDAGSVSRAAVVEKRKDTLVVELGGVRGVLASAHLSDGDYAENRGLFKKVAVGDELEVMVLYKEIASVVVTAKSSLIAAKKAGAFPSTYSEIHEGATVAGYVKNVTSLGVFVYFGNKLTGLVLKEGKYYKDQLVAVVVTRKDDENGRFWLSDAGRFVTVALRNPLDASKRVLSDFVVGEQTEGVVDAVEASHLVVRLADNLVGRVDASQVFGLFADVENKMSPLAGYKAGQPLAATVIGYYDGARFLGIATLLEQTQLALSLREYAPGAVGDYAVGSEHEVYIDRFEHGCAVVQLAPGVQGEIAVYNLSLDPDEYEAFDANFPVGRALTATVDGYGHGRVLMSRRGEQLTGVAELALGQLYPARVVKVGQQYVLVELGPGLVGYSYITDAVDDYSAGLLAVRHGQGVRATVTELGARFSVSLQTRAARDRPVNALSELARGQVVRGFVKSIADAGLFVSLGREIFALVSVGNLSDAFLTEWKQYYRLFQCVEGKITECASKGRVMMTMRELEVRGTLADTRALEDVQVGEQYDGTVQKVAEYGVFVRLEGTRIRGLCHRSEIAELVVDPQKLFATGDRVRVVVAAVDLAKRQLLLSMKALHFEEAEPEVEMEELEREEDEAAAAPEEEEAAPVAGLSAGFDWTASILDQAHSDESDDEGATAKQKPRTTRDRTAETGAPQSVADFERLVMGSPDSSVLWMNYMSFQLQLGEIEKLRAIAERALKTIGYREEQEKMNVWIALLNLENSFGTAETLAAAFRRAAQHMDALTMHHKLAAIYQLSEKFDEARELYLAMTKKFSKNPAVWVQYGAFLMEQALADEAHAVLARALQVLPKKDHVDLVRKFAQLEFAKGDAEQGRSLFEGLVADAPKRADIWNVYIDQEIKHGEGKAPALFERAVLRKLLRKQAKFFFSKWLTYEEAHGTEQLAARVKALATDYVKQHEQ